MLALFFVWTVSVLVNQGHSRELRVLNYSLLNQEQTISISLQSHFKEPKQVFIDKNNSSENIEKILNIKFTQKGKAISQISSLQLNAKLPDNSSIDFSNQALIKERSIFNYPNKIFLMEQNLVFNVRYEVSNSDNISYVRAFRIDKPEVINCTQIQVQQYNSTYYLFVACLRIPANNKVAIYSYKFTEPQSGFLDQLLPLGKVDLNFSVGCTNVMLYSYNQLFTTQLSQSKVLLGCTTTTKSLQKLFVLNIKNSKNVSIVDPQEIVNYDLALCLRESSKIIQYQKGFLSFSNTTLKYYSYNSVTKNYNCTLNFLNTTSSKFVTSVKDRDIHYIYVLYEDKIIIKQSYSPNYGVVPINKTGFQTMNLENYCIAQRFLGLLYKNISQYWFLTFDLRTGYPKLIDSVIKSHNYSFIFLYSVNNFLSKGNYYLVYDAVLNVLNLNCSIGYELTLTVNDSQAPVGTYNLTLTDGQDDLLLSFTFREFNDITLQKSSQIEEKLIFHNVLTLNLSNYVSGPLGRFYTYPNTQSLFQYVNYLCEVSVEQQLSKVKENLASISINNLMSVTLITFYFQNTTILTCQLDFSTYQRQAMLTQCKTTKTRKNIVSISKLVIVLSKEAFLQYDSQNIQVCQLIASGQYECSLLKIQKFNDLVGIKLVSYAISNVQQSFSLLIYCKKQILYCRLQRDYPNRNFIIFTYYHIIKNTLPDFAKMSIVDLCFDTGYLQFLVVRLRSDDEAGNQKVVVYDKPFIRSNSATTLIGHVIQVYENMPLQALFCFDNLLIFVTYQDDQFKIRQYKLSKEYRLRFTRLYPLYNFKIKTGGRHKQDQNFIFLQIEEDNTPYYLVYAPLLPTCNILSHKIQIKSSKIYFAEQIGSVENSSLILNGGNIIGVTVPNIILRFLPSNISDLGMTLAEFNVSVVDIMNTLSILNYQFSYNQKQQQINFLRDNISINLTSKKTSQFFKISADEVYGFVQDYNFSLPDTEQCKNFKVERTDVFTKHQSLLYYQSQQFGTLNDFVAIILDNKEVEVIVTDTRLFCVVNKQLPNNFNPSFHSLSDCRLQTSNNQILMSCINTTTLYRQIFNITVDYIGQSCVVNFQEISITQDLAYQDFDIQFTRDVIMLEVPIRMEKNKIYYKAKLQSTGIAEDYSLLVKTTDNKVLQSEFQTVDSTLSSEVFLLLQDGIGVYNLSDTSDLLLPALWIDSAKIHQVLGDEAFSYIMLLKIEMKNERGLLLVQLGTQYRTFQIQITFLVNNNSIPQQTVFDLQQIQVTLQYKQYLNCRNTISSYSQRFQNLVVKICSYQPKDQNVFANFISINNETANSLMQFYKKSGSLVFPFRIEVIYSNPHSNHQFAIINNTLVVGSLFNMLCYYVLTPSINWNISHTGNSSFDETCKINLILFNKHKSTTKQVIVNYDGDYLQEQYWEVGPYYIQRVVLFLILANTIRLLLAKRKRSFLRTRRKESGRLRTSRFEVMVKINSKKSI